MTTMDDVRRERETETKLRNMDVHEVVDLVHGLEDQLVKLLKIEEAAKNVANTLNGGFIRCGICSGQETMTDIDFAYDLYEALNIRPKD